MLNDNVNELIGLPWGFRDGQVDCAKLAVMAQKVIRGVNISYPYKYNDINGLKRLSKTILTAEVMKICKRVKEPSLGVWGIIAYDDGLTHLITFISSNEFLHIPINNTSRITRFTMPYQSRLIGLFWYKGE